MNNHGLDASSPASNPFSTRFISPAASDYVFPRGSDAACLIARLRKTGWWGQIIGPHGSGKTALLHTLLPRLEQAGRRAELYTLHESDRQLRIARRTRGDWNSETQVVVDGFEQLGWFGRTRLKRRCRSRRAGLLVTAHVSAGLPWLWKTETSLELAQTLVARLLPGQRNGRIAAEDVCCAFSAHGGNLREMFLSLYDVYEQRAGKAGGSG